MITEKTAKITLRTDKVQSMSLEDFFTVHANGKRILTVLCKDFNLHCFSIRDLRKAAKIEFSYTSGNIAYNAVSDGQRVYFARDL